MQNDSGIFLVYISSCHSAHCLCWLRKECCFEFAKAKRLGGERYERAASLVTSYLCIIRLAGNGVCIRVAFSSRAAQFTVTTLVLIVTVLDTFLFDARSTVVMNFLQNWCWKLEFESNWIFRYKHPHVCFHWNLRLRQEFWNFAFECFILLHPHFCSWKKYC